MGLRDFMGLTGFRVRGFEGLASKFRCLELSPAAMAG